ncbi:hypothetical protein LCGC14_2836270 [marine sediment metagenome]|uniref:Uncharacterized protein n=1 Tax=marine sediment metagenome TaxID=412755 RepID=A0A0F9B3M5_9ZZZZ|nr:MAG: hypothetical protein Lokiarch_21170 [Candidatus Lokiarchaeum sp. GC14_75]
MRGLFPINKLNLICCKCGNIIETLPQSCAQDILINEDNQILCYMGEKYGYRPLEEIICEYCQKKE